SLERTHVKIKADTHNEYFDANGEVLKFEGFLKVYIEGSDDEDEEQKGMLPELKQGEHVYKNYITATERYTRPPYRYTEASLVKKLEELGIGRPSTYAPTISTIQNRGYVERGTVEGVERKYIQLKLGNNAIQEETLTELVGYDKGKLTPTDIGIIVNDFLVNHFSAILDYNFTAKVEEDFDNIASGKEEWTAMMRNFYDDFHPQVEEVEKNAERETGERVLGTDPGTGRQVSVRLGRFGPMVQIGRAEDPEKPRFASLLPDQSIENITFEEALALFQFPKKLGVYESQDVEVNTGRYGPYVRFGKTFVSLEKGEDPLNVTLERAVALIRAKQKAAAPIATYKGKEVTRGKGRFGPFIKWGEMYINVSKKYDFDKLTSRDVQELIEEKLRKDAEKVVREWKEDGIRIEKGRWGRLVAVKGKKKTELPKDTDTAALSLEDVKALLNEKPKSESKK
ncbi:MAG: DNA topoisomerase I, partial [Sinomicrobium sp.]|nr:DNA topoisomerase I [Sinomicrobium sp.]